MQFGLALLLVLAAVSAFATTLDMERAVEQIYSSWWYITIFAFVSLNLLLCTLQRVRPLFRLAFRPHAALSAVDITRFPASRMIDVRGVANPLTASVEAFTTQGLRVTTTEGPSGTAVFGESGRLGYFGSLISHISLLVILLGAAYGVVTGYDVTNGGWVGSQFLVREGDFTVEINDIRMVQADDPRIRPRVYSDVTVRRGEEVLTEDTVSINYPVRFGGTTIYHTTFLHFPVLRLTDLETGDTGSSRFLAGDRVYLDANRTAYIALGEFYPHFSMREDGTPFNVDYRPLRPVAAGVLMRSNQQHGPVFLPINKAHVFETPGGRVEVVMTGFDLGAVYSISKNLGRPYLFLGSLLLLAGLYISFFIAPVRCFALLCEDGTLLLCGSNNRNRVSLSTTMDRIEARIKRREGAS
jgi:cytochrome c biogenesis protein